LGKRYRDKQEDKVRIPILFNLGRFTKNVDFEDLIVGYLDRKCGVSNPKFNIFKKMNDEGLFLLIFDGFDEMAMQVDFDTIAGNLKEVEKLTESPKSRVVLTSRPEYFISAKEEEEIFAPSSLLEKEQRKFDRLNLIPLNEPQIRSFLQRRIPLIHLFSLEPYYRQYLKDVNVNDELKKEFADNKRSLSSKAQVSKIDEKHWVIVDGKIRYRIEDTETKLNIYPLIEEAQKDWMYYLEKIGDIHDLSDLSKRPVMLDMITKTLPLLIKAKETINAANLYLTYLEGEIKRQAIDKKRRLLITRENRFVLMQTLAMHFYKHNRAGLTAKEVKELIKDKFTPKQQEELEANLRDFLTCSFLIREGDNYRFSHRSFVEYLTAKRLYDDIQEEKPDLFKIHPLTKEIRDFIIELRPNKGTLWKWIERTKHKSFDDVQYLGSNAITLLNLLGEELKEKDFSKTVLHNAYLRSADLNSTNFKGAVLKNANLNYTILKNTDFSFAHLEGISLGEMGALLCVAFSSDGRYLATASFYKTVEVWDVKKLKWITTLKGHTDTVLAVAFSHDGRYLASASGDHTVKIWDAARLKEITTLKGHTGHVWSVAFSHDGRYLACGSRNIYVWDVAKLKEIATLEGRTGYIWSVAFSPDGRYLAGTSTDRTVKVWDTAKLKEVTTFKGHTDFVWAVAFSPDGRYLASGSADTTIKVWDVAKLEEITTLKGHTGSVYSVAFSPDNRFLSSASLDKTIRVWDVAKLEEITTLKGHTGSVRSVAFSPDGKYIASGGEDNTLRIWTIDPKSKEFARCHHILKQEIDCVGMNIFQAGGLSYSQKMFLLERGAVDETVVPRLSDNPQPLISLLSEPELPMDTLSLLKKHQYENYYKLLIQLVDTAESKRVRKNAMSVLARQFYKNEEDFS
jgi:WD40 repeat protein